jgi:hypothetical protein
MRWRNWLLGVLFFLCICGISVGFNFWLICKTSKVTAERIAAECACICTKKER